MPRADVIFHGHFYQPPRENPWTDTVEKQWSAEPFHDWNARIDHECYAANAASPVYDENGRVEKILNNYEWISFNFGPTLLSWLEREDPATLERLREADRLSAERCGGHGNALAQVYNHTILPLADARDRRTQILWGRREFEHRFGRVPEGMWLAETAANHEVLDELARQGMRLVVLAPGQAGSIRERGEGSWAKLQGDVDPSRAYLYRSETDESLELAVFFYDGALGASCSFGRALSDGRALADAFEAAFDPARSHHQLLHVAVDGETAGHHVQWGNLALSWALAREFETRGFRITNYAQYLDENPPTREVRLDLGPEGEGTSWSCAHGVGRWIRDCGCCATPHADNSQAWRGPLRQAFDLLRSRSRELIDRRLPALVTNPQQALDESVELLLVEEPALRADFLRRLSLGEETDEQALWTLLELHHLTQLIYTSCAWFFDDIAGIEPVQNLRYAARLLELFEELGESSPREEFLQLLAVATSNEKPSRNGREIFEREAESVRVTAHRVAAHLAMSSVLQTPGSEGQLGLYRYQRTAFHVRQHEGSRLATGSFQLEHRRTGRRVELEVAMLHTGGLEFNAAVREFDETHLACSREQLHAAFDSGDPSRLRAAMDECFDLPRYGAEDLLEPEKQLILGQLFAQVVDDIGQHNAQLYEDHRPLLSSLRELGFDLPDELASAVGFALRRRLESELLDELDALASGAARGEEAHRLIEEVRALSTHFASPRLSKALSEAIEQNLIAVAEQLEAGRSGAVAESLAAALRALNWSRDLGIEVDVRRAQVLFFERIVPALGPGAESGQEPWRLLREALHCAPIDVD